MMDDAAIQKLIDEIDRSPTDEEPRSWSEFGSPTPPFGQPSVRILANRAGLICLARCFLAAALHSQSSEPCGKLILLDDTALKRVKKKYSTFLDEIHCVPSEQLIDDPVQEPGGDGCLQKLWSVLLGGLFCLAITGLTLGVLLVLYVLVCGIYFSIRDYREFHS